MLKLLLPQWADDVDVHPYPSIHFQMKVYGWRTSLVLTGKETLTMREGRLRSKVKHRSVVVIPYQSNEAVPWISRTLFSIYSLFLVFVSIPFFPMALQFSGGGSIDGSDRKKKSA